MSKRHDTEIEGFTVQSILKANFQRDTFAQGQGFPIEVHKVDNGPDKPDHYVATTFDGLHSAKGESEEEAARLLRADLQDKAIRGEL